MSEMVRESAEAKKEKPTLRREGTWPRMEGVRSRRLGAGGNSKPRKEGSAAESVTVTGQTAMERGLANLWKDRGMGVERAIGVGQESQGVGEKGQGKDRRRKGREADMTDEGRQRQEKQAGWWYQLMQSSQVYIDQSTEGSKFVKTEKRKKSSERHGQLPPPREGVVEGAESSQEGEGHRSRKSSSSSSGESVGSRVRPSWMGSPPEYVVEQEKESKPPKLTAAGVLIEAREECPSQGQGLRWGRLFGSSVGSPNRVEGSEPRTDVPTARYCFIVNSHQCIHNISIYNIFNSDIF